MKKYSRNCKNETVTVGELIAKLKSYPAEMPIITEGEGMFGAIYPSSLQVYKPRVNARGQMDEILEDIVILGDPD